MSIHLFLELDIVMGPIITAYAVVDVITDGFIAAAMCWLLHTSRTHYQRQAANQLVPEY
jgi:hypothetical protein